MVSPPPGRPGEPRPVSRWQRLPGLLNAARRDPGPSALRGSGPPGREPHCDRPRPAELHRLPRHPRPSALVDPLLERLVSACRRLPGAPHPASHPGRDAFASHACASRSASSTAPAVLALAPVVSRLDRALSASQSGRMRPCACSPGRYRLPRRRLGWLVRGRIGWPSPPFVGAGAAAPPPRRPPCRPRPWRRPAPSRRWWPPPERFPPGHRERQPEGRHRQHLLGDGKHHDEPGEEQARPHHPTTPPPSPEAASNMPALTPAHAANTTVQSSGMMVSVSSPRVAIASGRLPTLGNAANPISAGPPTYRRRTRSRSRTSGRPAAGSRRRA